MITEIRLKQMITSCNQEIRLKRLHHVPTKVHELPQSHCGDNREDTIYISIYIHI